MKKLLTILISGLLVSFSASALDFTKADAVFKDPQRFYECKQMLTQMLPQAKTEEEQAKVYWRLARVCVVIGQDEPSNEKKREIFSEGLEYAKISLDLNPEDPDAYMWYSANLGRECQTRNFVKQVAKLSDITGKISYIIDGLGATDYAPAWQGMAEFYVLHPFKSKDAAINFTRKSIVHIPSDDLRLSTYGFLATLLYNRNWSADKRRSEIERNMIRFNKDYDSTIDKYAFYDGYLGDTYVAEWSNHPLSAISDRQEALDIINFALRKYENADLSERYPVDTIDYNDLLALRDKFSSK